MKILKKYKNIVFDWDGTLVDTINTITNAFIQALKKINVYTLKKNDIIKTIGISLPNAIQLLIPNINNIEIKIFLETFNNFEKNFKIKLFKKVIYTLKNLKKKGYVISIATGKNRNNFNNDLTNLNLNIFDYTRCANESLSKPNPNMLLEIIKESNINCSETLMVGDSVHDLIFAYNANVDFVGVTTGVNKKEDFINKNLYNLKTIINKIEDLLEI